MIGRLVASAEYITYKGFKERIRITKDKKILDINKNYVIVK